MQNSCMVAVLGLVAIALLAGVLFFVVNLPDIERSRASAEWARAARAEARAELAAERRAATSTVVVALLAVFGLSTITVWLVAGLLFLRDTRQPSAPVYYIVADNRGQALDQVGRLGLPVDDPKSLVVIDGNYSVAHRRLT